MFQCFVFLIRKLNTKIRQKNIKNPHKNSPRNAGDYQPARFLVSRRPGHNHHRRSRSRSYRPCTRHYPTYSLKSE